jgi:membrane-bound lytic murein transglycosylase A
MTRLRARRRFGALPAGALYFAALLAGCAVKPRTPSTPVAPSLTAVGFSDVPGWQGDRLDEVLPALRLQCQRLALLPADTALGGAGLAAAYGGRAGQWSDACAAALALGPGSDARAYFEHWFAVYRIGTPALVTGYFEPVIPGSRTKTAQFGVKVLARPDDLVPDGGTDSAGRPSLGRKAGGQIVPYWTRSEIEAGDMRGAEKPIAYVASPIDLFFAQLQGSALVQLPEGGLMHLVFDGRNGRPYTPIGRVLMDQHQLAQDQVSMQTIRAWLEAHPDQAKTVMDHNESYIFFREVPDADTSLGPPGALGVDLTAGRSAAVDKRFVPLGAPLFVSSAVPDGRSWQHLVLAQDLGSAIEGPARVDVFLGSGTPAAEWAGKMRQQGNFWLLLPRRH